MPPALSVYVLCPLLAVTVALAAWAAASAAAKHHRRSSRTHPPRPGSPVPYCPKPKKTATGLPAAAAGQPPPAELDHPHHPHNPIPIFLAPMVDGSELAFRLLCRKHGATAAYTPMLRANEVLDTFRPGDSAQKDWPQIHDDDRPLVVQLCGHNPAELAAAVTVLVERFGPDGIDLNLGCPQMIAEKEGIGAFLAEQSPDLAIRCVRAMKAALSTALAAAASPSITGNGSGSAVRLSCKIRLGSHGTAATVAFAQSLQCAGAGLIAVHCRRREDQHDGPPDLEAAAALVAGLDIPVVVNGGVRSAAEARRVLEATGAHGVMVAQAFLQDHRCMVERAARMEGRGAIPDGAGASAGARRAVAAVRVAELAAEYLGFAEAHTPPCPSYIRKHLRWMFRAQLQPRSVSDPVQWPGSWHSEAWRAELWLCLSREVCQSLRQFVDCVVLFCNRSADVPAGWLPPALLRLAQQPSTPGAPGTGPGRQPTLRSIRHRKGRHGKKNPSTRYSQQHLL